MPKWRRSESRVVRPFTSVEAALTDVRFKLRADADFDDRTSFDTSQVDLRDIYPVFDLNVRASSLDTVQPLNAADLSLVVRLADFRLRRSELVFESGIEDLPRTWTVDPETKNRFSWKFGLHASVALVLRADRSPQPGLPFMRGHWIARKDFSVRSVPERATFPIECWTAEDFVRRGLPRDTVYWIDFMTDELNARFEDPGEAFRIYLRADVYDVLLSAEESPSGRAVMALIIAEILTEVLWRGLVNLESAEEIEKGGLLDSALARVKKATGANHEALLKVKNRDGLSGLRAYAQAAVEARKELARLRALR